MRTATVHLSEHTIEFENESGIKTKLNYDQLSIVKLITDLTKQNYNIKVDSL